MNEKQIKKLESAACKLRVKLILAEETQKNEKDLKNDTKIIGSLGYTFDGEYSGC